MSVKFVLDELPESKTELLVQRTVAELQLLRCLGGGS
jgi:hypothetical protein